MSMMRVSMWREQLAKVKWECTNWIWSFIKKSVKIFFWTSISQKLNFVILNFRSVKVCKISHWLFICANCSFNNYFLEVSEEVRTILIFIILSTYVKYSEIIRLLCQIFNFCFRNAIATYQTCHWANVLRDIWINFMENVFGIGLVTTAQLPTSSQDTKEHLHLSSMDMIILSKKTLKTRFSFCLIQL